MNPSACITFVRGRQQKKFFSAYLSTLNVMSTSAYPLYTSATLYRTVEMDQMNKIVILCVLQKISYHILKLAFIHAIQQIAFAQMETFNVALVDAYLHLCFVMEYLTAVMKVMNGCAISFFLNLQSRSIKLLILFVVILVLATLSNVV